MEKISKKILTISLLSILFIGLFLWQYVLYLGFFEKDKSCGGDWSYNTKCPIGTYCQSIDQGPLSGGKCKPLIAPLFDLLTKKQKKLVVDNSGGEEEKTTEERLNEYVGKISNCDCMVTRWGALNKKDCLTKCLGGQEELEEYLELSEKMAERVLSERQKEPLPEFVSGQEINVNRIAYIENAYEKDGVRYIKVDYVQWLVDTIDSVNTLEATRACVEDGGCDHCHPELWLPCMPNGYYIRNNDARTKEIEVSESAVIHVLEGTDYKEADFESLKDSEGNLLYRIRIEDGLVTVISEVYRP